MSAPCTCVGGEGAVEVPSDFTEQHARILAAELRRRGPARTEARRASIRRSLPDAAAVLVDRFGATRVWLIGSLDAPWFGETSDVDLVVEGLAPARAGRAEEVLVALLDSRVDLLLFEELEPSFQQEVERDGERLR